MSFRNDNEDYEAWLAKQCDVVNGHRPTSTNG